MEKQTLDQLFSRDKGKCKICGTCVNVGPYLITRASLMPNGGEVIENLITLCKDHCKDAAYYWNTSCRDYLEGFHPDNLYYLIKSSRQDAIKADKKTIFK